MTARDPNVAGYRRAAILSASALIFPPVAQAVRCVPIFNHGRELLPGQAWCLRGEHVLTLTTFVDGQPCPTSKETT